MRCNVLLTSAGRRGVLVKLFQDEMRRLFPHGRVLAGDLNPDMSSACCLADESFRLPPVQSPDYVPHLLQLCLAQEVGVVVPTIDTELKTLSEHCYDFERQGIALIVSEPSLVRVCRDKRLTSQLFSQLGLDTARTVANPSHADMPLFAKPYDGSCSIGTQVVRSQKEAAAVSAKNSKIMFVEYLDPAQHDEYTIDLYYDRESQLKCLIPRLRVEVRAGEVSKGRTIRLPEDAFLREAFENLQGAKGCITAQVFRCRTTGRIAAIEINPRFGGGYPLSYQAGANFPRWLLEEYVLNKEIEFYDTWEPNLTMLRYDGQVFVRGAAA